MNQEMQLGLEAWKQGEDIKAIEYFRRSADVATHLLEWAISYRLYGLALIQVQREVEGTFALEKADTVLEQFGVAHFDEDNLPSKPFVQFTVLEAFVVGGRYTVLTVNALTQDWRVKIGSYMRFELNGKQRRVEVCSVDIPRYPDGLTEKIAFVISERELRKAELHLMVGVILTLEN